MSYESTKTNSNLGASETMASDMPSQSNNTNFYTNNTNRGQTMMMNSMANAGNYYNGPATAPPTTTTTGSAPPPTGPAGQQQNQSANRPMYQSYPPSTAPHPPHHPILSPFDSYDSRSTGYYSMYPNDAAAVYEHQQTSSVGRNYYGTYGENHLESSSTNNNNHDMNATDSTSTTHEQHPMQQTGQMSMPSTPTSTGNGGYNPSMMPPPHPASKQQTYPNYSPQQQQQQPGDMYSRASTNAGGSQYMPPYSHYPNAGAPMMNPRSPATNTNAYRPPYSSGPPYQNGIGSPSGPSGKSAIRPQQVSPKRSTSQPTTPPQRYQNPYPNYTNGPVAYKPGGSNGYSAVPPQQQQPGAPQQSPSTQQQQQGPPQSWPPPSNQRDVATPSLASSTGDSDSNSSSASQQAMPSYPPTGMTNGPTPPGYPPHVSNPYNPTGMNDSNNNNMNSTGHHYMDPQYSNLPPPNYGYPPQQMNPYGGHPQQGPPNMHGPPTGEFRPPNTQSMDDENNPYRNKMPSGMMMDPQQQQQHHPPSLSQSHSVSSSTNGPKSPSGTSMSSYVPDDGESSNSSFADSPPPSNEKGHSKRKLSSASSNAHGTPAEVFTKLREMGDESERQDRHIFVDRLQKLWEEHQIVCRNLPSISKQTIDLYRLYTCVREQNGFQEFSKVAKNRHWRDIAAKLNIPNSSSAAFNVKQKYINLKLFHYECKFDRGGINPEPILAEIDKPQGKRAKTPKKGSSNSGSTGNNSNDGSNDGKSSSSMSSVSNAQSSNAHGQQQAPSSGPPGQQQMPNPGVQDPYRGYPPPPQSQGHPPHPHPMGHPQGGYRPMPMPMHPYGTTGNEMQQPYDPSVSGQMVYNNPEMDYQRAGYPPPGQPHQGPPPPQMMKGPGNTYAMGPPGAQIPQQGPPPPPPPGAMPPQHRPPAPYPSIATKPQQHQQQQQPPMVPPNQAEYGVPPQGATMPGAQPNQQAPGPVGNMPQQTYHYPPQQPMSSAYPPTAGYPQQRPPGMVGPPAPPNVQSSPHDPYMTSQVPSNPNYPSPTPMNYPYKKPENSTADSTNVDNQDPHKGNKLLMNQLRAAPANTSTLPTSSPISILTQTTANVAVPAMSNATMTPTAMPNTHFPPNSVEATTIPMKTKRKKLTAKDVTPVDPWKLMMSLRGGLLAETTWALDTINVMLADDQTHSHFRLKQMPGLLQAVIDVYLKCLTELFDEFKSSSSNIENQQPSLDELNGSSHLTCNTIKKVPSKFDESIAYRVESNYLNKYRRKYQKQQSIVYDQVYDEQGNEKKNPMNILDLQNTDDFCYVRTHFDPLRYDDNFYEKLYYGYRPDECSTSLTSDEHDHEPMKKSQISSRKRTKTTEGDMSIDDVHVNDDEISAKTSPKRRRHHSDSMTEISDSNKEFLERYKRKFEFNERISYELYPGIHFSTSSSSSSSSKSTTNLKSPEIESCSNSSEQQENASSLFTYHSLAYDQICARCTCVSSILRNLSFIAGNDIELVKSKTLIGLLARLLLLRHGIHQKNLSDNHSSHDETVEHDQIKDEENNSSPSFSWAECVMNIRENTLVTLANIAGALVLDTFDSDLLYTLIDGLLHWSTCYSGEAIDSFHSSLISSQRLAIEILTKLSVHEMNMDFILATPPFYRIVSLFHVLTDWLIVDDINGGISNWHPPTSTHYYSNLSRPQSHIQREFAIVLLNALTRCDPLAANVIARIPYAISLLINFIEDYEIKTNELMARYGPDYVIRLTTQPSNAQHAEQILFTTGDMLKRAATCLHSIVSYSDNVKMMKRYEDRILNLSISHVIDSNVGRVLTDVLHYCSLHNS